MAKQPSPDKALIRAVQIGCAGLLVSAVIFILLILHLAGLL